MGRIKRIGPVPAGEDNGLCNHRRLTICTLNAHSAAELFYFYLMNLAPQYLPHYTYDDYVQWEGRWEIINGIPYAMSPAPSPEHQWVASLLASAFITELKRNRCGCKVYQPIDYKLADDTVFQPDLLIVCKPITKTFLDFPASLVVEILSKGTGMKDRNVKFPRYEAEGIPYYLMVDADARTVEVYQLINNRYHRQPLGVDESFRFAFDDCSCILSFNAIWE